MGLLKSKAKTVRLDKSVEPVMARLREALENTRRSDVRQVKPGEATDKDVVAFGLWLASMVLVPHFALIDRDAYARRVDRELVMGIPNFVGWPEPQRLAVLDLILAQSAEFSGFHSASPLMSVPPEGRVS